MAQRPDDGPRGDALDRGLAAAFGPGPASRGARATLADSIGTVPHVLLRDTDLGYDAPLVKPASPEVPDGPGRYLLFGEIARGGMGAVLKGRDIDLGRDLAVKVLLEQHRDRPELVRRFVEEAQIGGQLQHPGIVPVYELGTFTDRRPYFAMKLVKGRTLAAMLDARGKPSDDHARFLGIFEQVAQTVAYAHARGVIHRDLKPSNVMVGAFREVQVMDWGLAKVLKEGGVADDERSQLPPNEVSVVRTVRSGSEVDASQAGSVLGTPAYMSPEQAAGDLDAVDERADVFGLGSILCEILTGRPAYTGRTGHEILRKAARGDTTDALARLASSGADPDLRALAGDCLAVEPRDRPRDAGVVASRLTAHLGEVQEKLRSSELARVEAFARAEEAQHTAVAAQARVRAERKGRRLTMALAASVFAVAGIAMVVAYQEERLRDEAEDRARAEAKAKEELETTLYFHRIALAHRELLEKNLLKSEELLDQCPTDRRAWEWYYLKRLCHVEPVTVRGQPGWIQTAAFSPDGQRLASASEDQTVKIWDATTGQELLTLPDTGEVFCAAFRPPDGRWLVTGDRRGAVTVWDTRTRQVVRPPLRRHTASVYGLAFSPNGRLFASASEDGTVKIWDAKSGDLLHDLSGHERPVLTVAFSPDGRRVASGSWDKTVRIWDMTTGEPIHTLRGHQDPVPGVAFSPDGRRLASASYDRTVMIWDVTTGQEPVTLHGHVLPVNGVAFIDGGQRLASVSGDKTMKIWDATTGQVVLTLRGHTHELTGLACSPDGRRLASASGDRTTKIWDATPLDAIVPQEALTLLGHTDQIWGLAFSPNGRRLASASWDKTVRVWDARTGREDLAFTKHIRVIFSVAFSPDGQRIASGSSQLAEGEPSCLKVWDATTGREVLDPRGNTVEALVVAFGPDNGRWLVTGNKRGDVTVWDATTGQVVRTLGPDSPNVWGLAFSPDGRRLASLSREGIVTVYDATRWGEKRLLNFRAHKNSVRGSLAFSPDGQRLVVPGDDNTVNIWDVTITGERRVSALQLTLRGHTAQVWGVAFSPDGRWVASAGEDNTVKLWNAHTGGEPVRTFRGHTSVVSRVAFSPLDGKRLASASFDKTVKVWDLTHLDTKLKE